jgi:bifunctional UDP-N-acetylglucosamine pyrophosphorylase/glucosamine-1-phosphate N-acetyltransferase
MAEKLAVVILAAGKSKRIKSSIPKVMHQLAGRPLITYPIEAAKKLGAGPILVVASPDHKELEAVVRSMGAGIVCQKQPLGTGHAVLQTRQALSKFKGYILILCGDVPLIRTETLDKFVREVLRQDARCGVLTMELKDPGDYGRIVRDLDGQFIRIVEAGDLRGEDASIREVNSGIFCVEKNWLFETLKKIRPVNSQNEYYLTDIIHYALGGGSKVIAIKTPEAKELLGVNTRRELSDLITAMRGRINERHMENGVGIMEPSQTYIDADVEIGRDTIIWPGTFILGKTRIGNGCTIENGVVLKNAKIDAGAHIKSYSVVEESIVGPGAQVGPFSRLRPGSKLGKNVKVGNFVEVKKSELKDGSKANHLTYLGDAQIGAKVNVGCGTITCNYDGAAKYPTIIGDGVFIGSDTQFVAPVRIGKGATIGAGSTITDDVPPHSLALSRAKQVIIRDWQPQWKRSQRSETRSQKLVLRKRRKRS